MYAPQRPVRSLIYLCLVQKFTGTFRLSYVMVNNNRTYEDGAARLPFFCFEALSNS